MKTKAEIVDILTEYPQYWDVLFCRGYLITDDNSVDSESYPFFGQWVVKKIGKYRAFIHPYQDYTFVEREGVKYLLVGHAFNPFSMDSEESTLIAKFATIYNEEGLGRPSFEYINEWTGIFALYIFAGDNVYAVQDCAGIQAVYYGSVKESICFTSHPQLVADLYSLTMDPFVQKLIVNRFWNIGNRYLPGDLSPYLELKRLGANVYLANNGKHAFSVHRFFPTHEHKELKTEAEYEDALSKAIELLHNGIQLIAEKWPNAAISLSGGADSRTTLACANGLYDRFKYYSFQSKDTEIVDSEAAHGICEKIGLKHTIYKIPSSNEEVEDFEVLKALIDHTTSYVKNLAENEIRKYIYLYRLNDWDVEVKSWISEIVRVFFDRKYGMRMPAVLAPRHFSIFQTRYFLAPELLKESDRLYADYAKRFALDKPLFNYEHTDSYYWEVRMSSWGMQVYGSQQVCHRTCFPWNNRKLMELLLSVPREKRIDDTMHEDMIERANPTIADQHVSVKNNYFKSKRILLEQAYYRYRIGF